MTKEGAPDGPPATPKARLTRRALLLGTGVAAGALGATAVQAATAPAPTSPATQAPPPAPPAGVTVIATGTHQSGIASPPIPQRHCVVAVAAIDHAALAQSLDALGEHILAVTDATRPDRALLPDGPGDLTVTVGLGSEALAATNHPDLAAGITLPSFAGDDALPVSRRGGDLLLNICASDPGVLEPVLARLSSVVTGYRELWSELGFRAASVDDVSRNPLGYHDGIIVPRTKTELAESVWISGGPLAGGTVCVMRRFALDTEAFHDLPAAQRDAVIGREQQSGVPLSGGVRSDPVDLLAKTDSGELLTPMHSHARAAHPSFTGSELMLRRSYAYRASTTDHGLLFISYQADVATFSRTQLRLDEIDDLMRFTTPTATVAFAILPGIQIGTPLGKSLFR